MDLIITIVGVVVVDICVCAYSLFHIHGLFSTSIFPNISHFLSNGSSFLPIDSFFRS